MVNNIRTLMLYKTHKNIKESYIDSSKCMRRMVGFAEVFMSITRTGALPEEASIHTAEMTAIKILLKEIHKRWVIYTDSQSSM